MATLRDFLKRDGPGPCYSQPMTARVKHLLDEAASFSEEERADLASRLLESLDPASEQGVNEAWEHEVVRRVSELRSGAVQTVPWEQVRQEALQTLNGARDR